MVRRRDPTGRPDRLERTRDLIVFTLIVRFPVALMTFDFYRPLLSLETEPVRAEIMPRQVEVVFSVLGPIHGDGPAAALKPRRRHHVSVLRRRHSSGPRRTATSVGEQYRGANGEQTPALNSSERTSTDLYGPAPTCQS